MLLGPGPVRIEVYVDNFSDSISSPGDYMFYANKFLAGLSAAYYHRTRNFQLERFHRQPDQMVPSSPVCN